MLMKINFLIGDRNPLPQKRMRRGKDGGIGNWNTNPQRGRENDRMEEGLKNLRYT